MFGLLEPRSHLAESGSGFAQASPQHIEIDEVVEKGLTLEGTRPEVVFLLPPGTALSLHSSHQQNLVHDKAGEAC